MFSFYYKLKNFYNWLSNRALGFLILVGIFFIWYIFYWYLFSYNLSDIKIISNVSNYEIKLKSDKYKKEYSFKCLKKECILKNVSPFNYKLEVLKDNYETYTTNFNPNNKKFLKIILHKKIYLKPLGKDRQDKNLSREEKIELVKLKNKYFWYKKIWKDLFIFKDLGNKLEFSYNNNLIGFLEKLDKKNISLNKVINSDNFYFLKFGNKSYLIDKQFLSLSKIDLNLKINYFKKINNNFLLINTEKGSFLYDLKNKWLSYFNSLYDFIILDNWKYLWILKNNIIQQKKNLWLWNIPGDLLVEFDLKTKKVKLLKKLNFTVNKLYKKNLTIIIEDKKGNKYELINFLN